MLTADTITDEQIRELQAEARAEFDVRTMRECGLALDPFWDLWPKCRAARARCAEILNARAAEATS
jgi:hypothetical protein